MTYYINENYKIANSFLVLERCGIFLVMKQLFSHCNIEDFKLMRCIINFILDLVFRKSILHCCQSIVEIKTKIKNTEKVNFIV